VKKINFFLLLIFIFFVSCTQDHDLQAKVPLLGNWGGKGIRIVASETQTNLEFDCAAGVINKKVMINNNLFSVKGTYTHFSGNMPIDANPTEAQNVIYEGSFSGNNVSLTIKSEDGKKIISKYTLAKNADGIIVRCM